MRRLFAFLLIIIVLFIQTPISVFSHYRELSFEEYSLLVAEMVKTYDLSEEKVTKIKNANNDGIVFTNRLIIRTFTNMPLSNDCGAIDKVEGFDCLHILQYADEETALYAYNYYSENTEVQYVENDFNYNVSWGSIETDRLTSLEKSDKEWGSGKAKSNSVIASVSASMKELRTIVVAVIDSGIDYNHPLFNGRLITSSYDYVDVDTDPYDIYGHGTYVSGIIVKNSTNNVKVKPYRTIFWGGGNYVNTCNAIKQAVRDNVDIINISLDWDYTHTINYEFSQAISKAQNSDIPVIVSAGNDGSDANGFCPARNNYAITVAATRINNSAWEKSNYGSCVDIAAPGSNIYSADRNNNFLYSSGTSAAAPFVSAAAAILKFVIPGITNQQIKDRLKNTAYVPPGWDTNYGAGIVDFKAMLADQMTSPPNISVGSSSATITAEPEATIYYTTDKTDPTVESTVYSEPISTANIKELRAIAVKSNLLPSEPTRE